MAISRELPLLAGVEQRNPQSGASRRRARWHL